LQERLWNKENPYAQQFPTVTGLSVLRKIAMATANTKNREKQTFKSIYFF